jgi:hypothetical protein
MLKVLQGLGGPASKLPFWNGAAEAAQATDSHAASWIVRIMNPPGR